MDRGVVRMQLLVCQSLTVNLRPEVLRLARLADDAPAVRLARRSWDVAIRKESIHLHNIPFGLEDRTLSSA